MSRRFCGAAVAGALILSACSPMISLGGPDDGGSGDARAPADLSGSDLAGADLASGDSATVDAAMPCGAIGQACCAPASCDPGAVCSGAGCVAAVQPAQCPMGATGAVFVGETAPPATLAPWQSFQATVTFANCTGAAWTAVAADAPMGYKLGTQAPQDNDHWLGTTRVALPADVPAGMQVTVGLPVRAGPLTGPRTYSFGIVDEAVAWVPEYSPVHTIDVEAAPNQATLCPNVTADIGGGASASAAVQSCIDAAAAGSTLELPAGIYRVTTEIDINKPLTLRTAGTAADGSGCLDFGGAPCVVLRADDNLSVPRGFLRPGVVTGVTLDHILLDGNRAARTASAAAAQCAAGNNGAGFNATTPGCTGCSFVHSGSARALCGTGFEWVGDGATFSGSTFRGNGDHATANMWSDGLTLLKSNGATVSGCAFIDNSDVDLILGGDTNGKVQANYIRQFEQASFAGLMLDNFNGGTPGDFSGTMVSGNTIDCGAQLCDFAIELGPHPWYLSANITGGTVTMNTAYGGKFGINCEGAGTAQAPVTVTGNTVGTSPGSASFNCGARAATAFNVSPDSVVSLGGGPQPTGAITFHGCP